MLNLITITLSTPALRLLVSSRSPKLDAAHDLYRTEGYIPRGLAAWLEDKAAGRRASAQVAQPVMQGEGRAELTGRVQALKQRQTEFGTVLKALVLLETGCKCWVTVPEAFEGDAKVGQIVAFRGTVKHPKGGFNAADPFVVATRPSNWRANPVEGVLAALESELEGFVAADLGGLARNEGDAQFASWEFGEVYAERLGDHHWALTVTNDDRGDSDNPYEFGRRRVTVACDYATRPIR